MGTQFHRLTRPRAWGPKEVRHTRLGTGTLHQNIRLPRKLTLYLCGLVPWALTSALEGDHETRVASALATSLDQTLTLAQALCPWEPNSTV